MAASQVQVAVRLKGTGVTYLWWFFLGGLGVHKFYLGRPGLGVIYALTLGLLGIGLIWDLFTIPSQVRDANRKLVAEARQLSGEPSSSNWRSLPDEADAASPLSDPDEIIAKYMNGRGRVASIPSGMPSGSASRAPLAATPMGGSTVSRPGAARASFGKKRPVGA